MQLIIASKTAVYHLEDDYRELLMSEDADMAADEAQMNLKY